ncbi:MAG: methyltransferase domain-containing protein [Desulforhopalus sp.]
MVTIYQDYSDEPEDVFLPLPEDLACEFYALEMGGFTEDINFFEGLLPRQGTFLELGCGTGRIAQKLAEAEPSGRRIIGIDISTPMLRLASRRDQSSKNLPGYVCMDMVQLAFSIDFDAILIPYNTLNLLNSENKITECLNGCRKYLKPEGMLLVQLFIPSENFIRQRKTFQFQMFDRPDGGKLIKELVKQYEPLSQSVLIEERYRVRPLPTEKTKEDWNSVYSVAGFSVDKWLSLFSEAGFSMTNAYGDYSGCHYQSSPSSILIVHLTL